MAAHSFGRSRRSQTESLPTPAGSAVWTALTVAQVGHWPRRIAQSSLALPVRFSRKGKGREAGQHSPLVPEVSLSKVYGLKARDSGEPSAREVAHVDVDRANLAHLTNADVSDSIDAALHGVSAGVLRDGNKQIPILGRMRMEERAQLSDLRSLYVFSREDTPPVPLDQVATVSLEPVSKKSDASINIGPSRCNAGRPKGTYLRKSSRRLCQS